MLVKGATGQSYITIATASVPTLQNMVNGSHDYVIKWKHFTRNWPLMRGIHRWPGNSPHTGKWRGVFRFSLICAWINGWVNNCKAGDFRRHRPHYDVILMIRIQYELINAIATKQNTTKQCAYWKEYTVDYAHYVCIWSDVTTCLQSTQQCFLFSDKL